MMSKEESRRTLNFHLFWNKGRETGTWPKAGDWGHGATPGLQWSLSWLQSLAVHKTLLSGCSHCSFEPVVGEVALTSGSYRVGY